LRNNSRFILSALYIFKRTHQKPTHKFKILLKEIKNNRKEQAQQAQERQALLESKYSRQDLQKVRKFNPILARSALESAKLNESRIETIKT
jgi:hypothetical protein